MTDRMRQLPCGQAVNRNPLWTCSATGDRIDPARSGVWRSAFRDHFDHEAVREAHDHFPGPAYRMLHHADAVRAIRFDHRGGSVLNDQQVVPVFRFDRQFKIPAQCIDAHQLSIDRYTYGCGFSSGFSPQEQNRTENGSQKDKTSKEP